MRDTVNSAAGFRSTEFHPESASEGECLTLFLSHFQNLGEMSRGEIPPLSRVYGLTVRHDVGPRRSPL